MPATGKCLLSQGCFCSGMIPLNSGVVLGAEVTSGTVYSGMELMGEIMACAGFSVFSQGD